jgi:hypothetical protein
VDESPLACPLADLGPVVLRQVRRTPQEAIFNGLIEHHHYLGYRQPVGEHLKYIAVAQDRPVACLAFSSVAYRLAARDAFIGWDDEARRQNLHLLAYNTRFLIPDWVRVPHLTSHLLGVACRRLSDDWLALYRHPVHWVETMVDSSRFAGTVYRAANWITKLRPGAALQTRRSVADGQKHPRLSAYPRLQGTTLPWIEPKPNIFTPKAWKQWSRRSWPWMPKSPSLSRYLAKTPPTRTSLLPPTLLLGKRSGKKSPVSEGKEPSPVIRAKTGNCGRQRKWTKSIISIPPPVGIANVSSSPRKKSSPRPHFAIKPSFSFSEFVHSKADYRAIVDKHLAKAASSPVCLDNGEQSADPLGFFGVSIHVKDDTKNHFPLQQIY